MQNAAPSALTEPVATITASLIAFAAGFIAAEISRRQKADELFFKALDFLRGGTQNRNLGLSAIELYWSRKRHRAVAASLLVGSAIYLLRQSKHDSAHERYNLERIMNLLLKEERPPKGVASCYTALCVVLKGRLDGETGGIDVPKEVLTAWHNRLVAMQVCRQVESHSEAPVRGTA